ncbi:MAG TPA: hypothetical protein VFZ81_10040 [Burkholderiales bacterium]
MGQLGNPKDFMLIITASQGSDDFHPRVRSALQFALAAHSEVALRADFDVGPREHVEVFTAPDIGTARDIAHSLGKLAGLRAELAPLRHGW